MSDRGSVALKNVRAAEGLVDMIQTTRDFRPDLGGGGGQISGAMRRRTGGSHSHAKISAFLNQKNRRFALSFSACDPQAVIEAIICFLSGARTSEISAESSTC